jgi:hypothetical protein
MHMVAQSRDCPVLAAAVADAMNNRVELNASSRIGLLLDERGKRAGIIVIVVLVKMDCRSPHEDLGVFLLMIIDRLVPHPSGF